MTMVDMTAPSVMARTIEIDRYGDVLLQFPGTDTSNQGQQDPTNLLVSSSILSLISPVFHAIFNSPLSEGIAFHAPDSPRPFPLPLPEDNAGAFELLLNVAHHKTDLIPPRPLPEMLVDLAVLADKYSCAQPLVPYGVLWLQRGLAASAGDSDFKTMEGMCEMLVFAYVMDMPEEFAAISWEVLMAHRQGFKDEVGMGFDLPLVASHHELLRHDIQAEFQRRKARLRRDLLWAIMQPVEHVSSQVYSSNGRARCENAAVAIGHYLFLLDRHGLSPWRAQYETDSFDSILRRARTVSRDEGSNLLYQVDVCEKRSCSCAGLADRVNLARLLGEQVEEARMWKLGVCLDCLKSDGEAYNRRACRVEHW